MNYCDENSTPRDRISAELFFSEYGTEMRTSDTGCGCTNTTRAAQTRASGCNCANSSRAAQQTRTIGCGCTRTAQTRTTGCGCANNARTAETRTTGCGCGNTARTAQTRTTGCGCGCGCGETSRTAQTRSGSGRNAGDGCPDRRIPAPSLAMAYVPMQQWRDILDCEDALTNGTLFGELVLPFYPTPCNNEGCQRRRSI